MTIQRGAAFVDRIIDAAPPVPAWNWLEDFAEQRVAPAERRFVRNSARQASPLHQKLVEVRLTGLGEHTIDHADALAAVIERGLRAAIGEKLFESLASIERIADEQLGD